MSTRGAIVHLTNREPVRFTGVYHHWDSYPQGLGATLWHAWHGHFGGSTEQMLRVLIEDHPAGWSTINGADFSKPAGYGHRAGPECYCHGERSEEAHTVTEEDAAGIGCEWVYAFDEGRMLVLRSLRPNGVPMIGMFGSGDPESAWRIAATIDLAGTEPDWSAIDAG